MYCVKCGTKLDENGYCSHCKTYKDSVRTVVLTCKTCKGTLIVEKDRKTLTCPYCNSSELIVEDSDVQIQRIKSET